MQNILEAMHHTNANIFASSQIVKNLSKCHGLKRLDLFLIIKN